MVGTKKSLLFLTCVVLLGAVIGLGPAGASGSDVSAPEWFQGAREAKDKASFPHDSKKHKELACSECHKVSRAKPDVRDFPGHEKCISCHNFALMVFTKPVFCAVCHNNRPLSKKQPALFRFPKTGVPSDFGIGFSHVSHRRKLPDDVVIEEVAAAEVKPVSVDYRRFGRGQGPKCTDCHSYTRQTPEMAIEKGHSTCFSCHGEIPAGGRRKAAKEFPYMGDCGECHEPGGSQSPHLYGIVKSFRHYEDHDYDIRPRTKAEYRMIRATDYLCSECHTSIDQAKSLAEIRLPDSRHCDSCHNNRIGLPDVLSTEVKSSLRRR